MSLARLSRPLVAALAVVALTAVAAGAAEANPRHPSVERVSVSTAGGEARGPLQPNSLGDMTADGRYVVFGGWSNRLTPEHHDDGDLVRPRVYLRDRATGETELVSVDNDGVKSTGGDRGGRITDDGRYVAFWSSARLVSQPTPGDQVFVRDREAGSTELVSVNDEGEAADRPARTPAMTPDGRYVAFTSQASNLVDGDDDGVTHVFVRDRAEDTTHLVSVNSDGEQLDGFAIQPHISADGRYVLFDSQATNAAPGNPQGHLHAYRHDRQTGETIRVSVADDGSAAAGEWSLAAGVSSDGRYVLFTSDASNLVPHKTNQGMGQDGVAFDVYVRDVEAGTTERVSVSSHGDEGDGDSAATSLSPDGRYATFTTDAQNFADDSNPRRQVFVHDRLTGVSERVSETAEGIPGDRDALYSGAVTPDGGTVAFSSYATNLTPDIGNEQQDVFVRERGPGLGVRITDQAVDSEQVKVAGLATFSGAELTSGTAETPADDVAGLVGAALSDAAVVYRHDLDDIQVRWNLADMSTLGGIAVQYGLRLTTDAGPWELRVTSLTVHVTRAALFFCEPVCVEVATVAHSVGVTGPQVRATVPLSELAVAAGDRLRDLEAFAAVGEGVLTEPREVAAAALDDTEIPEARVELTVAPASGGDAVAADADLDNAVFSAALSLDGLPAGDYLVGTRACLGALCDGPEPTTHHLDEEADGG